MDTRCASSASALRGWSAETHGFAGFAGGSNTPSTPPVPPGVGLGHRVVSSPALVVVEPSRSKGVERMSSAGSLGGRSSPRLRGSWSAVIGTASQPNVQAPVPSQPQFYADGPLGSVSCRARARCGSEAGGGCHSQRASPEPTPRTARSLSPRAFLADSSCAGAALQRALPTSTLPLAFGVAPTWHSTRGTPQLVWEAPQVLSRFHNSTGALPQQVFHQSPPQTTQAVPVLNSVPVHTATHPMMIEAQRSEAHPMFLDSARAISPRQRGGGGGSGSSLLLRSRERSSGAGSRVLSPAASDLSISRGPSGVWGAAIWEDSVIDETPVALSGAGSSPRWRRSIQQRQPLQPPMSSRRVGSCGSNDAEDKENAGGPPCRPENQIWPCTSGKSAKGDVKENWGHSDALILPVAAVKMRKEVPGSAGGRSTPGSRQGVLCNQFSQPSDDAPQSQLSFEMVPPMPALSRNGVAELMEPHMRPKSRSLKEAAWVFEDDIQNDELHKQLHLRFPDEAGHFTRLAPGKYAVGRRRVTMKIHRRRVVVLLEDHRELPLPSYMEELRLLGEIRETFSWRSPSPGPATSSLISRPPGSCESLTLGSSDEAPLGGCARGASTGRSSASGTQTRQHRTPGAAGGGGSSTPQRGASQSRGTSPSPRRRGMAPAVSAVRAPSRPPRPLPTEGPSGMCSSAPLSAASRRSPPRPPDSPASVRRSGSSPARARGASSGRGASARSASGDASGKSGAAARTASGGSSGRRLPSPQRRASPSWRGTGDAAAR